MNNFNLSNAVFLYFYNRAGIEVCPFFFHIKVFFANFA